MLKIITAPNKILSSATRRVTKIDGKIKKLIKEMEETLLSQKDPKGVGLAAPQVGKNLAVFIMKPTPKSPISVFINPKILKSSTGDGEKTRIGKRDSSNVKVSQNPHHQTIHPQTSDEKDPVTAKRPTKTPLEGCLSVPKIWSPIKRANKVLLQYQNLTGAVMQKWFTGFEAVIIQHEVDHLNGILFTQRALEQKTPLYEEKDEKLEKLEY